MASSLFLLNGREFDLNLNTTGKYPYTTYRFDFEDSNILDLFVSTDNDIDIFIHNVPSDRGCSWYNARIKAGTPYHRKLSMTALPKQSKRLFLSIVPLDVSEEEITVKVLSNSLDEFESKQLEYFPVDQHIWAEKYKNLYHYYRKTISRKDVVTEFTLSHFETTDAVSKLFVSTNEWKDRTGNWHCTASGGSDCSIVFEPCKQQDYRRIYIDAIPIAGTEKYAPLSIHVDVREHTVRGLEFNKAIDTINTGWEFYELEIEDTVKWTSDVIKVNITSTKSASLQGFFSRDGISTGHGCSDASFVCTLPGTCIISIITCDLKPSEGNIFLNIKSSVSNAAYTIEAKLTEPVKAKFGTSTEYTIDAHETQLFLSEDSSQSDYSLVTISKEVDSEGELSLSIIRVNESSCPTHSECTIEDGKEVCELRLMCIDYPQQPYIRVMNLGDHPVKYQLDLQEVKGKSFSGASDTLEVTGDSESWLYKDSDYGYNMRFNIETTAPVHINLYRNCTELRSFDCVEGDDCDIRVTFSNETLKGRYWLRVVPESTADVSVTMTHGIRNCENITTTFCGNMSYVDAYGEDLEVLDNLAKDSYDTLTLTKSTDCDKVKEYVCGVYFPHCDENGMAPTTCRESCYETFGSCELETTCPNHFCSRLPKCPIPPPPYRFYSGYIALIVIFGLLVLGIVFVVVVYVVKG